MMMGCIKSRREFSLLWLVYRLCGTDRHIRLCDYSSAAFEFACSRRGVYGPVSSPAQGTFLFTDGDKFSDARLYTVI